jgi:hypothetical protein
MQTAGIITILDNNNYGNRLQNYALQEILKKNLLKPITVLNEPGSNTKEHYLLRKIKNIRFKGTYSSNEKRKKNFAEFNSNILFSQKRISPFYDNIKCDLYITGSDQVWNPTIGRLRDVDLLSFSKAKRKISYAASIAINEIPAKLTNNAKKEWSKFSAISLREDRGKEIVEELAGRKDVEVLVDPTMLLTAEEWDKVSKKPEMLKNKKYILNYFLGELSDKRKKEIERVAEENNCEIINILDENSPYYECGPSEFLYLEKNAFLVCTDSFHSSVFAILYNTPFLVFDRDDKIESMNSRIETLLSKFKLEDRKYTGKITSKDLKANYSVAYTILEKERAKSQKFLEKALKQED